MRCPDRKSLPYQLAAIFSHLGNSENDQGHYMMFLRIFGQRIQLNDTEVDAVEESEALHKNFPETESSPQIATILLYVADNCINNSVNNLLIKYSLSSRQSSSVNEPIVHTVDPDMCIGLIRRGTVHGLRINRKKRNHLSDIL
jgi:hypothetical protein